MTTVPVFTIGFTQTTAERFFGRLERAGVRRVIDVRLNNSSQLAGFAKAKDLEFFLKKISGIDYRHEPKLAPTKAILDEYKKNKGEWDEYVASFEQLMEERATENAYTPADFEGACLLCSEATPKNCHRRLVVEYLNKKWEGALSIRHL